MQTPGTSHKKSGNHKLNESWEIAWKLPTASPSLHSRDSYSDKWLKIKTPNIESEHYSVIIMRAGPRRQSHIAPVPDPAPIKFVEV